MALTAKLYQTGRLKANGLMNQRDEPESLAMDLAWFLTDRLMLIETKTPSHMKNTAKTTSPAFFKPHLQINDLQSSLMIRVMNQRAGGLIKPLNISESVNPPTQSTSVRLCHQSCQHERVWVILRP
jgi:hypothetical protein